MVSSTPKHTMRDLGTALSPLAHVSHLPAPLPPVTDPSAAASLGLTCLRVTSGSQSVHSTTCDCSTLWLLVIWLCSRLRAASSLSPSLAMMRLTAWQDQRGHSVAWRGSREPAPAASDGPRGITHLLLWDDGRPHLMDHVLPASLQQHGSIQHAHGLSYGTRPFLITWQSQGGATAPRCPTQPVHLCSQSHTFLQTGSTDALLLSQRTSRGKESSRQRLCLLKGHTWDGRSPRHGKPMPSAKCL